MNSFQSAQPIRFFFVFGSSDSEISLKLPPPLLFIDAYEKDERTLISVLLTLYEVEYTKSERQDVYFSILNRLKTVCQKAAELTM